MSGILVVSLLALGATTASAQESAAEPKFDSAILDECLDARRDGDGDPFACIGRAANRCMETPEGGTTVGTSYCLKQELDRWDLMLNEAYGAALTEAEATDAEMKELGSAAPQQAPLLRDMQRKWIAFRDVACAYEESKWGGGSGGGPASVQCAMKLTAQQYLNLIGDQTEEP
ncbi:lysozyme inhibitor LprI family protein [Paracoccus pacificus]|uniref:lysozyme inhibitor LprI family protein n=1 Tax=Paracoccus pacificus TaxID=1463598 RepID=UPI0036D25C8D